jgi:O-antigen/teichoic acid export membrane protein
MSLKHALIFSSVERYFGLIVNFAVVAIVSRLLTPQEIGLSVIGTASVALAETLRDFGIGTYLIQKKNVSMEEARTAFTVTLVVSLAMAALFFALAPLIAATYHQAELTPYLRIIAVTFVVGPLSGTAIALLRRDMRFGDLARLSMASGAIYGAVVVGFAIAGFSFMSFAYAGLASSLVYAVLSAAALRRFELYRPCLQHWRSIVAFGGWSSATALVNRAYDVLPYFALARLLPFDALGLYSRAQLVCQLPDKYVMTAIAPVALPALANELRAGRALKPGYLRALTYISALHFPMMIGLALYARPFVEIALGAQWLPSVPLIQIMCLALLFNFPAVLTYPTLVASSAVRDTLTSSLLTLPVCAALQIVAGGFGLQALALSQLVIVPFLVVVSLAFVRRHLGFTWSELVAAIAPSAAAALAGVVAGAGVLLASGAGASAGIGIALISGLAFVIAWAGGLVLFRHPLAENLRALAGSTARRLAPRG